MTRRLSIAKASVDELATLRQFVRRSVADLGGSQRVSDDLVQAVDEAACNVILHGYRGQPGELDVEATVQDRRIEIRILDRAPVFDPTAAPEVDTSTPPQPPRPGNMGVGIHLARTMTDEVRHDVRPGGGNELTLIHSIDGAAIDGTAEEGLSMAMTIDVEHLGGSPAVSVVALDGELDASNYEQVIQIVKDAWARGSRGLVLDLSRLSFMASSGLFALHSAARIMRGETPPDPEAGWGALHQMAHDHDTAESAVRLAAPQEAIRRVLDRTGMLQLFAVDDSRDAAVAALAGG